MFFSDYFKSVLDGVEFLIALGSIIGLLILMVGILMILAGNKNQAITLIIISICIIAICGLHKGTKYFRI